MNILPKDKSGCPYLQLAPMEGVGDRAFRKAMASMGGFDEAVREFIRVPRAGHVNSLAREFDSEEMAPIPLAAQIMGSDPSLMGQMAQELVLRGARRIDVNCGCPSNTVTGKGAGSSLLKEPNQLYQVVRSVVQAVSVAVTIKMRSGYEDTSLFFENLAAAQETGVQYLTLHPRTKVDGYGPPANWELIAQAKSFLKIPVVGNGDIRTVDDAVRMWKETGCDALMIGRGSLMNPFLFHQIRSVFSLDPFKADFEQLVRFFRLYASGINPHASSVQQVGKLKQIMSYFCRGSDALLAIRPSILSLSSPDPESFLASILPWIAEHWKPYTNFNS